MEPAGRHAQPATHRVCAVNEINRASRLPNIQLPPLRRRGLSSRQPTWRASTTRTGTAIRVQLDADVILHDSRGGAIGRPWARLPVLWRAAGCLHEPRNTGWTCSPRNMCGTGVGVGGSTTAVVAVVAIPHLHIGQPARRRQGTQTEGHVKHPCQSSQSPAIDHAPQMLRWGAPSCSLDLQGRSRLQMPTLHVGLAHGLGLDAGQRRAAVACERAHRPHHRR